MTPRRTRRFFCSGSLVITDADTLDRAQASGRWIKTTDTIEVER